MKERTIVKYEYAKAPLVISTSQSTTNTVKHAHFPADTVLSFWILLRSESGSHRRVSQHSSPVTEIKQVHSDTRTHTETRTRKHAHTQTRHDTIQHTHHNIECEGFTHERACTQLSHLPYGGTRMCENTHVRQTYAFTHTSKHTHALHTHTHTLPPVL